MPSSHDAEPRQAPPARPLDAARPATTRATEPMPRVAPDSDEGVPGEPQRGRDAHHSARGMARRRVALIVGITLGLAVAAAGARYAVWGLHHESTDDAFIDGHIVHVAPQVAGRVLRVLVADNQPVRAGDLLIEIDPTDFEIAIDQSLASQTEARGRLAQARAQLSVAEAGQAQAQADVVAAQAEAANAAADLSRYRATRSDAVSKQAVDSAKTAAERTAAQLTVARKKTAAAAAQAELARSQIVTAEGQLAAADAAVEHARIQRSYAQIRAPEAGRVTVKHVEPGNYVQIGQDLLALVSSDLWVEANFKETQLARMRPGLAVAIHVDAYPDEVFRGHIESIQAGSGARFSLLPPQNATGNYVKVVQRIPVKIVFDDPTDHVQLGPGMSVVPDVTLE